MKPSTAPAKWAWQRQGAHTSCGSWCLYRNIRGLAPNDLRDSLQLQFSMDFSFSKEVVSAEGRGSLEYVCNSIADPSLNPGFNS